MSADPTRTARIALAHLAEPGRRDLGDLVRQLGPIDALTHLRTGNVTPSLHDTITSRLGPTHLLTLNPQRIAELALERAAHIGARIITPEDPEWPPQLTDLTTLSHPGTNAITRDTDPPHSIWIRGPWPLSETCEKAVGIVGSRAASAYGNHVATELGHELAGQGWTVISGGAFGIDAAAHRGALTASGRTIAVLACGIDRTYPTSHHELFRHIAEQGLLLSEWPPGSDPHRHRFLVRNRVIAALSQGTVVVEAGLRSGARFTLGRARALNRHVMAVPGPVTSATSVGCHEELRIEGTVLVTGAAHVIEVVGRIGADLAPIQRAAESPRDRLTPLQRQVLDGVRPRKILTAEQLAAAVGVSTRDARRALPALERECFVTAVDAGYRLWRRSDRRSR